MTKAPLNSNSDIRMKQKFLVKMIPISLFFLLAGVLCSEIRAQINLTGIVRDSEYQAVIPGASVTLENTENSTRTDASGRFVLKVPTHTTLTLVFALKGFETTTVRVITANKTMDAGVITLRSVELNMLEIYQLSDRATWQDPVTYTNQEGNDPDAFYGLAQLPNALQYIPGVYTSERGNHYGATRINIRGFGQQHISVMLNGVPANDPDSRDFTWAGRDGFTEQFSTLQVQKGTNSSVDYAPYMGGMLNFISKPARRHAGVNEGFEYGAGNYLFSTFSLHSGLLNEKFAISLSGSRKTADGIAEGTWSKAWTYYLALTYAASEKHRFEVYAMGTPQRHGQVRNMQHIAAYSHNFASEAGVPEEILEAIPQSAMGRSYNQGINHVDPSYAGQQYWNGKIRNRYAATFLNEHEHYSHAPVAQFNWYASWADKISQQTILYYSAAREGKSGVSGDVNLDYTGPSAFIDYNSTIAENEVKNAAEGILNNSVRDRMSVGAISRLNFHISDKFSSTLGLNVRSSGTQYYQEVRDLLGAGFFNFTGNEFDDPRDYEKQLGAIIGYHHTNQLLRFGFSGELTYTGNVFSAFTSGAWSMGNLTHTNHLQRDPGNPGNKFVQQPEIPPGFQIKSGISLHLTDHLIIYSNYGYHSREPDNQQMRHYLEGTNTEFPSNLSMKGLDAGIRFAPSPANGIAVSYYDYLLENSTLTQHITDPLNNAYQLHVSNIDQHHRGIELDADFRPFRFAGLEANASLGKWNYAEDANGTLVAVSEENATGIEYTFRNKGIRSGNAPQLQLGTILSVYPAINAYLKAGFRYFGNHFSTWNPAGSLDSEAQQVWMIPDYYLIDLHAGYTFKARSRYHITIRGHVFNLLDELYIPDALNNGALSSLPGDPTEHINSAAAASVFIGLPRTFSIGMQIAF